MLYLTVQQKFTFEPPDDGTVGDSVAKTSELSAPMEVQILKKPSFEQPKIDSYWQMAQVSTYWIIKHCSLND